MSLNRYITLKQAKTQEGKSVKDIMKKIISFEKLSKKKQREENSKRRRDWGGLNPVTRKPPNQKAYNRRKAAKSANDEIKKEY